MDINVNDILNGTGGRVWWNGRLLASLTKCEAKMTGDFEDVSVCGDAATHTMFNGWSGSGTLTFLKVDSVIADQMIAAYTSGNMPDIQIVTALTNARTKKSARYQISGVVVTEIMVAAFEAKKQVEEEIPFNFSRIQPLETISA